MGRSAWLAMTTRSADDVSEGLWQFGSCAEAEVRSQLGSGLRTFCVAGEKTDP
jgi:hypothetical protein